MGGPLPRSWARIGLPSYCLSRLLGGMGGPRQQAGFPFISLHVSFLGSWVGWVSRGQEAGLPLCSLHVSFFVGSWVGWARGQEAGLALGSLRIALRGWAPIGLPSYFLSGLLGRMGSWAPVDLPSCFLLSGLLGGMGGPRSPWAPFILPQSDGWGAAKKLGFR